MLEQKQKNQLKKDVIMKRQIKFLLAVFIVLTFNCSCQNKQFKKLNTFDTIKSSKMEYRDSMYIIYTIKTWMDANFDSYHDYSKDNPEIKKNDVKFEIIKTFYSPDKLKLFCWLSIREKNNIDCSRPQGFYYSSSDIIGFRNSTKELWKLYPLELMKAGCFDTQDEILNQLGQYYFVEMKNHSEDVNKIYLDKNFGGKVRYDLEQQTINDGYGDKNNPNILKDYGYNLQDKDFWTKSLIWQKGARIKGLYNFQTLGNVQPDEDKVELLTPKVNYPDSILKLYK